MISEPYGIVPVASRNITQAYLNNGHNAIDIGWHTEQDRNAPIWAWKSGVVKANAYEDNTGYFVDIEHYNEDGTKQVSHYVHLKELGCVKVGQEVKQGDTIGYRGNTGHSFGEHLHFAISKPYTGEYSKSFVRNNHIDPVANIYWSPFKKYDWYMDDRGSKLIKPMPTATPTDRDITKDQIEIKQGTLNMRLEPTTKSASLGFAPIGIYNVLDRVDNDLEWFKIGDNVWVAKVDYVEYYPAEEKDYKSLYFELADKLNKIKELL